MLDKCPQCNYAFTGLPADHACPECGLRYDERSEVYKHRRPASLFLGLGVFACVPLFGVPYSLRGLVGRLAWLRPCIGVAALFWWAVVAWLAWRALRLYRSGPLVAIVSDGLYVRLLRAPGDLIPWDVLHSPTLVQGSNLVMVSRRDSFTLVEIENVFKTRGDAERFKKQVQQRVTEASSRGGTSPTHAGQE